MPNEQKARTGKLWSRPVFHVDNVIESVSYYCEKLGFEKDWIESGSDPDVAQVSRNGATVILDGATYFPKAARPSVLTVTLNDAPSRPALDALHRELLGAGAKVARAPFKVHWDEHVYEMVVEDLDVNVLMFWGNMPTVA